FGLAIWQFWPSDILPRPLDVVEAFRHLWLDEGLLPELLTSYWVQLQALAIAVVASLLLSYASVIQIKGVRIFKPVVEFISTWRFISLGPLVIFLSLAITARA